MHQHHLRQLMKIRKKNIPAPEEWELSDKEGEKLHEISEITDMFPVYENGNIYLVVSINYKNKNEELSVIN